MTSTSWVSAGPSGRCSTQRWFDHVSGFLIGRPLCYDQELMGLDQYHAVIDLLQQYHVPIVMVWTSDICPRRCR